jgi:hypothetical protein
MISTSVCKKLIDRSRLKFKLDLKGLTVLTEAATGNYAVTAAIVAAAGGRATAFAKASRYGSYNDCQKQTMALAQACDVAGDITIIDDLQALDLTQFNIITNTGFLRPISSSFINRLSPTCVIPLMWEPWEFRSADLDLEACRNRGIKVYGTNESDPRLRTMDYLGFVVLHLLLANKRSPFSSSILILGCDHFAKPIYRLLKCNGYDPEVHTSYSHTVNPANFDAIVIAEHNDPRMVIGESEAFLKTSQIDSGSLVIHIAGQVDFSNARFEYVPEIPAQFGYMSYTTDYIDPMAVIDLHTAGLSVAQGMIVARKNGLAGADFKNYMENNYPSLSFDDERFW